MQTPTEAHGKDPAGAKGGSSVQLSHSRKIRLTVALVASVFVAGGQPSTSAVAQTAGPRLVSLTPGICPVVADGDIVTLAWNPGFEHEVAGLQRFELAFAKPAENDRVLRQGAPLRLIAAPRLHGELPGTVDSEIEPGANGFFLLRLHVQLSALESGEYVLVDAYADARMNPDSQGRGVTMTNSPLRSSFCLNVVAKPGRRG